MASVSVARLESLLHARQLDRTLIRPWDEPAPRLPTGHAALDEALKGGWRQGEISELVGPGSTGRTSTMLRTMVGAAAHGGAVGLVDVLDRFDPRTSAAAGLDLTRVVWIRGPVCTAELGRRQGPLRIESAIRQGIRALDLILRAGSVALAVLDLADVPSRELRRLPSTTWLRLAHVIEHRDIVCLLVGEAPMGRSARGATVRLECTPRWTGSSLQSRRFEGFEVRAHINQAGYLQAGDVRWTTGHETGSHR